MAQRSFIASSKYPEMSNNSIDIKRKPPRFSLADVLDPRSEDTIVVPRDRIGMAQWFPEGSTRFLTTSCMSGCVILIIVSPRAGIMAVIDPAGRHRGIEDQSRDDTVECAKSDLDETCAFAKGADCAVKKRGHRKRGSMGLSTVLSLEEINAPRKLRDRAHSMKMTYPCIKAEPPEDNEPNHTLEDIPEAAQSVITLPTGVRPGFDPEHVADKFQKFIAIFNSFRSNFARAQAFVIGPTIKDEALYPDVTQAAEVVATKLIAMPMREGKDYEICTSETYEICNLDQPWRKGTESVVTRPLHCGLLPEIILNDSTIFGEWAA